MKSEALQTIELQLPLLSIDEQAWLLDNLARRARDERRLAFKADLAEMANDPQIQAELRQIDAEFRCTEMDGLEDSCLSLATNH